MGIFERAIDRWFPQLPVLTPMPDLVRRLRINPALLALHMAGTRKPSAGTATGLAPKSTVPPL